jgi:hypothetical protein
MGSRLESPVIPPLAHDVKQLAPLPVPPLLLPLLPPRPSPPSAPPRQLVAMHWSSVEHVVSAKHVAIDELQFSATQVPQATRPLSASPGGRFGSVKPPSVDEVLGPPSSSVPGEPGVPGVPGVAVFPGAGVFAVELPPSPFVVKDP